MRVPFFEFRFSHEEQEAINGAFQRVIQNRNFVLGSELVKLETEISEYLGVKNVIGVGNGYDALFISLKALSQERPLKVLLQSNAYHATINAVINSGNTPVFAPFDYHHDGFSELSKKYLDVEEIDLILPIHYFGKANIINDNPNQTPIMEDFSQAFGTVKNGEKCGSIGLINAASLYPTKNFGALGDAGIITTDNPDLAQFCRSFRNYGEEDYYNLRYAGVNSRLDEVQAVLSRLFLSNLDQKLTEKRKIANYYFDNLNLPEECVMPEKIQDHTYYQFTLKTSRRDELKIELESKGVGTKIHYPRSIYDQEAYQNLTIHESYRESTRKWHNSILSLPSFAGITEDELDYICNCINNFFK